MTSKKDLATSFLRSVTSGHAREAYEKHVKPGFRHHNPFYKGDAKSLMEGMEGSEKTFPEKSLTIHRAIEEGDLVAVHSHIVLKKGQLEVAVVHIFRF